MMSVFLLSVALTLAVVQASGSFNAEEISSVLYDVDILGDPKLTTEMTQAPTSMLLLSKHGQRYECQLPVNQHTMGSFVAPEEKEKKKVPSEEDKAELKASLLTIPKLLDDMATDSCLRLSKGWWEYEFCFRNRIRQYHLNEQTGAVESEVILGQFASDYDWNTADLKDVTQEGKKSRVLSHSQHYSGGSTCDLTGQPRRAEVRFFCDPTPLAPDLLVDVEEPSSCVYRLTVRTGRLCAHPLLRKAAEEEMPSRRKAAESIQCRPLLEPASMQRYKKNEAAKRLLALKAAELEKLRRIQRLNPLRRLARIRHVIAGRLGRPLRRRKLEQLVRRRRQRLTRVARPKKAKRGDVGNVYQKLLRSLPAAVRQKLTSKLGLETLRASVGAQFQQVLEEARREVGGAGETTQLPQEGRDRDLISGPNGMASILENIISEVDDAGRRLDAKKKSKIKKTKSKHEEGPRALQKSTPAPSLAKKKPGRSSKHLESLDKKKTTGGTSNLEKETSNLEKISSNLEKELANLAKESSKLQKEADTEVEVEQLRDRLEAGIRQKMERRGIETNGMTLHLLSLADSQIGKENDASQKSYVGIIILKNDRQIEEKERMQRIEKNYNFRVDDPPDI